MKIYRYDIWNEEIEEVKIASEVTIAKLFAVQMQKEVIYFFDPEELAYEEAMEGYANKTTCANNWICDGTSPCATFDGPCDHPNHM